jgi:WD40 repeat protein
MMSTPAIFLPTPDSLNGLPTAPVLGLQVSANYVISSSADRTVCIWLKSTSNLALPPLNSGIAAAVKSVEISEELGLVLGGDGKGNIVAWRLSDGERLFVQPAHNDTVLSLALDGNTLVSSSRDQCAKIWELSVPGSTHPATLQLRHTLQGHSMAVLAVKMTNGRVYTTSGDKSIRVWDQQSGDMVCKFEGLMSIAKFQMRKSITGIQQLLAAGTDGTVRLYNLETGAELACLVGHTNVVCSVHILGIDLEDSTRMRIASASYDGTIRLWTLLPEFPFSWECVGNISFTDAVILKRTFTPRTMTNDDPERQKKIMEKDLAKQQDLPVCRILNMQVSDGYIYCSGESAHVIAWKLVS